MFQTIHVNNPASHFKFLTFTNSLRVKTKSLSTLKWCQGQGVNQLLFSQIMGFFLICNDKNKVCKCGQLFWELRHQFIKAKMMGENKIDFRSYSVCWLVNDIMSYTFTFKLNLRLNLIEQQQHVHAEAVKLRSKRLSAELWTWINHFNLAELN